MIPGRESLERTDGRFGPRLLTTSQLLDVEDPQRGRVDPEVEVEEFELSLHYLPRFGSEYAVSNNISAVGGNASLLSLSED